MKKVLGILGSFAIAFAFSATVFANDPADMDFHMNVRFMQSTPSGAGTDVQAGESRWGLHCVELSAAKEVDNIGGILTYRIADTSGTGVITGLANTQSYPVEAKVYYKFGVASKITAGLQLVPFAIYNWNNLYDPFADIPGQNGLIWDADWGFLYTYNAKPLLIDVGWWDNAGEIGLGNGESPEKNTVTARVGYDLLSNLNAGASYMEGDMDLATLADDVRTDRTMWALDTTWGIVPNLTAEAEYVKYDLSADEVVGGIDGNLGLIQLKYDIVQVPAPFNKVSLVGQYSMDDPNGGNKTTNYQEQISVQAGKNLSIFWQNVQQNVQQKTAGGVPATVKYHVLAFKYDLF